MRAVRAGALYFAIIFALGFVLGTIRTLVLAPAVGPVAAVLAEVPILLGASWFVARRLVVRHGICSAREAGAMGLDAFSLLIAAEAALALALGDTLAAWAAAIMRVPGLIGLAAQIGFGLMPLMVRRSPLRAA